MGLIYIGTWFPPFSPLLEVPPSERSGVAAAQRCGHEVAPGPLLQLLDPLPWLLDPFSSSQTSSLAPGPPPLAPGPLP